jgi:fructose-1,6-bisphosphatase
MSKSLLEKLRQFLFREQREQAEKKDKLRKILAKMREKQKKLEQELAETDDQERQAELGKKIRMLKEQRKKGVAHLETLHRSKAD